MPEKFSKSKCRGGDQGAWAYRLFSAPRTQFSPKLTVCFCFKKWKNKEQRHLDLVGCSRPLLPRPIGKCYK